MTRYSTTRLVVLGGSIAALLLAACNGTGDTGGTTTRQQTSAAGAKSAAAPRPSWARPGRGGRSSGPIGATPVATPTSFIKGTPIQSGFQVESNPVGFTPSGSDEVALYNVTGDATSADSCSNNGGPVLQNAHLVLVFWGNDWNQGAGTQALPSQPDLVTAVSHILQTSYLDQMAQYGFQTADVRKVVSVTSQPPNNFTSDDVFNMLSNNILDTFPEPDEAGGDNFYMVFPSPSVLNQAPAGLNPGGGWHGSSSNGDIIDPDQVVYSYVTYGSLNGMTATFTHELVEAISDPTPDDAAAWLMERSFLNVQGENEIGDACNSTVDFLDGILVEAYFSQAQRACVIPYPAGPTITSVNPPAGPISGQQAVIVNGSGFDTFGSTTITLAGTPAGHVKCLTHSQCSLTTPAELSGTAAVVDLKVTVNHFSATAPYRYGPVIPSCSASFACHNFSGGTTIDCPLGGSGATLTLMRFNPSTSSFQATTDTPTNVYGAAVYTDWYAPPAGTHVTYEVRAVDVNGTAFSAPMTVTTTDCSCHPSFSCSNVGAICGTINDGCGNILHCGSCDPNGSTPVCSANQCCPIGQSWNANLGMCTSGTQTCTTPAQCCVQGGGAWNGKQCE
jgi:hypothetical protein